MNRKRHALAAFLAAVALALAVAGCGGGQEQPDQDPPASNAGYVMVDSLNANGDSIGKRAVATADKADLEAMTSKEFETFVEDVVRAAGDGGADYLTVDFGDGTGLTFPSCSGDLLFYGELDEEGMMAGKCDTYRRSKGEWTRD